jgi:hypothetical protein
MGSALYPDGVGGVQTRYVDGVLQFLNPAGQLIYSVDPVARMLDIPVGAALRSEGSLDAIRMKEVTFEETEGAGTYTALIAQPPGSTLIDLIFTSSALWDGTGDALAQADFEGLIDEFNSWWSAGLALSSVPGAAMSTSPGPGHSQIADKLYTGVGQNIEVRITKPNATGTSGRSRALMIYAVPLSTTVILKVPE